jgi:hypothetical protein
VGAADVYLITLIGRAPISTGGLSCCPSAEVFALRPRVAILSMEADGHRLDAGANPDALNVVQSRPASKTYGKRTKLWAAAKGT